MARYIDANYLFKCQTCRHFDGDECDTFCDSYECYSPDMSKIPTADVVEVKHGKWIMDEIERQRFGKWGYPEDHKHYCSCCNKEGLHNYGDDCCDSWWYLSDYCPNCGAKMDGDT